MSEKVDLDHAKGLALEHMDNFPYDPSGKSSLKKIQGKLSALNTGGTHILQTGKGLETAVMESSEEIEADDCISSNQGTNDYIRNPIY